MKKLPLLFGLSLIANAALVAVLVLHQGAPPIASDSGANAAKPSGSSHPAASGSTAAAASVDLANLPPDLARQATVGRALERLQAAAKQLAAKRASDPRYWRRGGAQGGLSREDIAELTQARREFNDALRAAFGPDASIDVARDSRNDFLPAAKAEELRRIEQDYADVQADVYRDAAGIQLPSDRAKLALLRAERDKDIAALLTPEELAQFELHSSATAQNLRARYGDAIESEDDYKKLFALQKAFDQKYPNEDLVGGQRDPNYFRERALAQQQIMSDFQTAIGDEKYAAFKHATDPDYQALTSLSQRLNLPASTADNVLSARDTYAAASQRINADTSLSPQDKRTQIQALAAQAKNDVSTALGAEGSAAFSQRAQWLNYLNSGMAFTTNPKDSPAGAGMGNQSVYPVFPAGARVNFNNVQSASNVSIAPDGTRQVTYGTAPPGATMIYTGTTTINTTTTTTPAPTPAPSPKN